MNMQVLALAFLAFTAIGGLAWVFIYPSLSGEKKAEIAPCLDCAAGTRRASGLRQDPALAPRAGRRLAEGTRGAPPEGKARPVGHATLPGRSGLDAAEILDGVRRLRGGVFRRRVHGRRRTAGRRGYGLCRGLRSAALDAGLSQEAPREGIYKGAARRRRRHRARHQGRPAAVRNRSRWLPPTHRNR